MEFKFKKTLCTGFALLGMTLGHTASLSITNDTNHDSTSIINHGPCSTILGESGVTRAHTTNVIAENILARACMFNKTNCQADVYMTSNCTGPKIATALFNIYTGVKSVEMFDDSYSVSGGGFNITLSGGPAFSQE
jgi:hypothetical protein